MITGKTKTMQIINPPIPVQPLFNDTFSIIAVIINPIRTSVSAPQTEE